MPLPPLNFYPRVAALPPSDDHCGLNQPIFQRTSIAIPASFSSVFAVTSYERINSRISFATPAESTSVKPAYLVVKSLLFFLKSFSISRWDLPGIRATKPDQNERPGRRLHRNRKPPHPFVPKRRKQPPRPHSNQPGNLENHSNCSITHQCPLIPSTTYSNSRPRSLPFVPLIP